MGGWLTGLCQFLQQLQGSTSLRSVHSQGKLHSLPDLGHLHLEKGGEEILLGQLQCVVLD